MVFKNCHRPNSGTVIYTDKGCVTTVGGSATSLKQMKLIDLNHKEHGFCFFELGSSTFYYCVIKTLEQNCSFPFCCLFIATSPNPSILLLLSASHPLTVLAWLCWLPLTASESQHAGFNMSSTLTCKMHLGSNRLLMWVGNLPPPQHYWNLPG